jgi:multimeric flavodoxin WrbA
MKAYILSDGEFETEELLKLDALVKRFLSEKGFAITEKRLAKEELDYCRGCFGCWIKTPGECVMKDSMTEINRGTMASDVAIYLVPVVFGQYSANMKNALDRWIPNLLPFFNVRKNGDTIHPKRYEENPQFVMIGYGDGLTQEDRELFQNITTKHRDNGEVLIYDGDDAKMERDLAGVRLQRTEGDV